VRDIETVDPAISQGEVDGWQAADFMRKLDVADRGQRFLKRSGGAATAGRYQHGKTEDGRGNRQPVDGRMIARA
jgi:hypothetical protein